MQTLYRGGFLFTEPYHLFQVSIDIVIVQTHNETGVPDMIIHRLYLDPWKLKSWNFTMGQEISIVERLTNIYRNKYKISNPFIEVRFETYDPNKSA